MSDETPTTEACLICGDSEPFHVHNGGERIEDYFTVGRGQTEFQAAQAWQAKYRAAATQGAARDAVIADLREALHEAAQMRHEMGHEAHAPYRWADCPMPVCVKYRTLLAGTSGD